MNWFHSLPVRTRGVRGSPSSLVDSVLLADGRSVTVRPVLPTDLEAERRFVVDLSPQSRWQRFHLGIASLSDEMLQAFTCIDYRTHVALIAARDDDAGPVMVADARYAVLADTGHAEFAIAVADDWQGIGLGREMLVRLGMHARRSGLRRLCGDIVRGNAAMIGLARNLGGRVYSHPDDMLLMRVSFDF
ncbi:MAG: GNAT family N-acetyltransferase [Burkholderiales bacterium]|nr:GNAT family N-acetyltransferase [Burkholderiales bacterium]